MSRVIQFPGLILPPHIIKQRHAAIAKTSEQLTLFAMHVELGAKALAKGDSKLAHVEFRIAAFTCPEAWLGIAGSDLEAGDLQGAFEKCCQVFEFSGKTKTRAAALNNMGMILTRWHRREEAFPLFCKSFELDKQAGSAANIATILKWKGRLEEAIQWAEKAVRLDARCYEAHFVKAISLLLMGDFRKGFSEYEVRWRNPRSNCRKMDLEAKEWSGEPLKGKSIVVYIEQGAGDTIQMLRYFPILKERGAKIFFASAQGLKRLVEKTGWVEEVIEDERLIPKTDFCISTMSLPRVIERVPSAPYLDAAVPIERSLRRKQLVGLVWAGSADHVHDKLRSVPLEQFRPILDLARGTSNLEFVSLQVGPGEVDLLFDDYEISQPDRPRDFLETAQIIAGLDLVISVDTSVVHLAGAMGKPVWMLTPFAPDWRWMLKREDSVWYPSLRLFRQEREGDWGPVIARIRQELRKSL